MKTACVCSGDKNIIFSAIITLDSIKRKNNNYDLFVYTDVNNISIGQKFYLDKYDINLITDTKEIKNFINNFNIGFGRYPKEIFYKFCVPLYFKELNYDYIIVLDSDIICYKPYVPEEIYPKNDVYSFRPLPHELGNLLSIEQKQFIIQNYNLTDDDFHDNPPNAGVLIFNLERYLNSNFTDKITSIYQQLNQFPSRHGIDELCLGVLNKIYDINYKKLNGHYNMPAAYGHFNQNTKNLHFSYAIKPWNLFESIKNNTFKFSERIHNIGYLIACMDYIRHARKYPFFDKLFKEEDINYEQILGLVYNFEKDYKQLIG